ncbi:unnamed protein product [Lathyrus oleraceus]
MINEKRKQRELELGDLSKSLDHNPSPSSRQEKWKRARQRLGGEFTSKATRDVAEKIDLLVEKFKGCISVPRECYDILVE